jgi:hypothetical protein
MNLWLAREKLPVCDIPPARRHFSLDFPYSIIFVEKPDYIWIVAVMHMKRRPSYWRQRLGDAFAQEK